MRNNKTPLKDYYAILGVARNAPPQEIRKAFRKQAHVLHPDRNYSPGAKRSFREIAEAYEVMKSTVRRNEYDARVIASYCGDMVGSFGEKPKKGKAYRAEFRRIMGKPD